MSTRLRIRLIGWTHFDSLAAYNETSTDEFPDGWTTDADGGPALVEFAGRACYQSWSKPNPATATNAGYLQHILEVGHLSVLEHGTATFYLTGVSRSLTHELIRHRHFSYSQLSQRYVTGAEPVEPDVIRDDPYLHGVFRRAWSVAEGAYAELLHALERKYTSVHQRESVPPFVAAYEGHAACGNVDAAGAIIPRCVACGERWPCPPSQGARTAARKLARQAARAVLPNATETRIVVTGNYRAWRHFITMRASEHADVEIRALAVACLGELMRVAPNVFGDFTTYSLDDGSLVASTPHGGQA